MPYSPWALIDPLPVRKRIRLPDALGALRHRDFRLFWFGAMFSFIGSWVQMTGQQWLVLEITNSKQALGLVTFLGSLPLFFFSPLGGWFADRCNKRVVLVVCSSIFALSAFILSAAVFTGQVTFNLIAALAFVNGIAAVIEIPTRQAMISNIVAEEDIGNAIPLNAATFNLARVIGPAIGGVLLANFGAGMCYLVNGISFAAIILAVLAIHADLSSNSDRSASLRETLFEGIYHVARSPAMRTLVMMMATTALFGIFYISFISALATNVLNLNPKGYSMLLTSTGIGAIIGVLTLASLGKRPWKGLIPNISMVALGASLILLAFVQTQWQAMIVLAMVGAFGIGQMVGTNTALQYFAPPELRGRIVAVHMWSLAGLNPLSALMFGWISERIGLPKSFLMGGVIVLLVGLVVLLFGRSVRGLR